MKCRIQLALLIACACVLATPCLSRAQSAPQKLPPEVTTQVDKVFEKWNRTDSPGCALGVYKDGQIVYNTATAWPTSTTMSPSRLKRFFTWPPCPSNSRRHPSCCFSNRANSRSTTTCTSTFPSCPTSASASHYAT